MAERDRFFEESDDESLVDRSVSFVKDLSSRIRHATVRRWRTTHINLDVGLLRQRRRYWLLCLGREAFAQLERGEHDPDELRELADEIRELNRQIAEKESLIAEFEDDDELEAVEQTIVEEESVARRRPARRGGGRREPGSVTGGANDSHGTTEDRGPERDAEGSTPEPT